MFAQVVKRQKFNVPELYRPNGIYSYGNRFRTNWRALAACVIGAVPGFPGWVSSIGSPNVCLSIAVARFACSVYVMLGSDCGRLGSHL